jgi:peptide/nickel transport system permease protein
MRLMVQMCGGDTEMLGALRRQFGLNGSLPVQFGRCLLHLVKIDLGFSAVYNKQVATIVAKCLAPTLRLMGSLLCLSSSAREVTGAVGAPKVQCWFDTVISIVGTAFYATHSKS